MKIGRNDPCPCGSGKKYKKCCLTTDEARAREQLAALPAGFRLPAAGEPLTPYPWAVRPLAPLDGFYPELPDSMSTPEQEAADARWEAFDAADGFDERHRLFRQFLDEGGMAADEAVDLLLDLDGLAGEPAQQDHMRALIEAIKTEAPHLYRDEAAFYDSLLITDAVNHEQFERVPALLESLLRDPERHIDELFDAMYELLFHDQTALALTALRRAWPAIRNSADLTQWRVDEFEELLLSLTLAHYAAEAPQPNLDAPALAAAIATMEGTDADDVRRLARPLLGQDPRPPRPSDFGPAGEERWARLEELTMAWLGTLLRQGVPVGRAVLARLGLLDYFQERLHDKAVGLPLLTPRADLLLHYLSHATDSFSSFRVYLVVCLLQYLPSYPALLASSGLITPDTLADLDRDVHQAQRELLTVFREHWQDTGAPVALEAVIAEERAD